jgi:hypothetical protein
LPPKENSEKPRTRYRTGAATLQIDCGQRMNDEIQVIGSCGNVFLDLGFSSEEATLLKMRADLNE